MKQLEIQAIQTICDYDKAALITINTIHSEIVSVNSNWGNAPNKPDFTNLFKLINQAKENVSHSLTWSNALKIDLDTE